MSSHPRGRALQQGATAGLAGGAAFAAAMAQLGTLSSIASLVGMQAQVVALLIHLATAVVLGAAFGALVRDQTGTAADLFFWGLVYGWFWWFLGALTISPLISGQPLAWDVGAVQDQFPSLLGHLAYGASAGLVLAALRRHDEGASAQPVSGARVGLGALAGVLGGWVVLPLLSGEATGSVVWAQATLMGPTAGTLALGAVIGAMAALARPHPQGPGGPALIRGGLYGLCWWIVGPLTAVPLLAGSGLAWSVPSARAALPVLLGYLLVGASVTLVDHWLTQGVRVLLSDALPESSGLGVGTIGVQAFGRGLVAGVLGGLAFTVVLLGVDGLPRVAGLIGSTSPVAGLVVHSVIAFLIGIGYGLLFRHLAHDTVSALGWGLSYGFFWWVLGGLTLLPLLLGGVPQWGPAGVAAAFPSLIGHLAYGAILGVVFQRIDTRYSPWWMTRVQAQADILARQRELTLSAAPALWALTILLALLMPTLLATS